jgi:amino acid adenylation domain-containing protein
VLEANVGFSTLSDVLHFRSEKQPHQVAFRFIGRDSSEEALTYLQLHERACALRAALHARGVREGPVAILLPNGPEFISTLLGTLYAGCIPAPLHSSATPGALARSENILSDLCPKAVLTNSNELAKIGALGSSASVLLDQLFIDVGSIEGVVPGSVGDNWPTEPDSLALIQYTSGSTSLPKGVKISHRNLVHNASRLALASGLTVESVGVSWLPLFHDMGLIGSVIMPLYVGFPAILLNPTSFLTRPFEWLSAISRYRATVSGGPNFAYDYCVRKLRPEQIAELDLHAWSTAYTGAEPIRADTIELFARTFERCGFRRQAFFPCYGLAESTLIVTGGPRGAPVIVDVDRQALQAHSRALPPGRPGMSQRLVSSGCPIDGQSVVIVDVTSQKPCSENEIGEIWISGPSVGAGYWGSRQGIGDNFAGLSAGGHNGAVLKTGDLGFMRDGHLFIVGRSKDLIIINGLNHYPEDIEQTVERSHSALVGQSGVSFAAETEQQDHLVIVHEVSRRSMGDSAAIFDAIRRDISKVHGLAVHEIVLVNKRAVPKTTSGKVQRQAARAAFHSESLSVIARWSISEKGGEARSVGNDNIGSGVPADQNENASRVRITEIICTELGKICNFRRDEISDDRSLFDYGLDSLRIMELRAALIDHLGSPVEVSEFFDCNSIAEFASRLAVNLASPQEAKLETQTARILSYGLRPRNAVVPLSFAQERLWFLEQLESLGSAYTIVSGLHLTGPLDRSAVQRSLVSLFRRHRMLRTKFVVVQAAPVQVVVDDLSPDLDLIDLSDQAPEARTDEVKRRARDLTQHRFKLEDGRLSRFELIALGGDEHVLLCAMHHIISDAWSMSIFAQEFGSLYAAHRANRSPELSDLPIQYADYACWQREHFDEATVDQGLTYWRSALEGAPYATSPPTDRARPMTPTFSGGSVPFAFDATVSSKLAAVARREGATLFMVLASALQILLARWSGQDDVVVGFPIAGRTLPESKGLIGLFLNMLPLRTKISGNPTFVEILQGVRKASIGAYEHQDIPFEKIVRSLRPTRDPSRHPIFQVMINSWQLTKPTISIDSLIVRQIDFEESSSKFDLSFYFLESSAGDIRCRFTFNSDLYDTATIERLVACFGVLVKTIAGNPDARFWEIPLVEIAEARQWVDRWRESEDGYPRDLSIHELFAIQVAKAPNAIAVVDERNQLTYAELDSRSCQLAHHLRALGAGPEVVVGLCLERSVDAIVGLLAILKAGAAYLPLDPAYPPARIEYMLTDSKVGIVITQAQYVETLILRRFQTVCLDGNWPAAYAGYVGGLPRVGMPENLACVVYTSGSTGKPKGVMVEHRQILNYTFGIIQRIPFEELNRFAMVQSLTVGSAFTALYPSLLFGKCLHLISRERSLDADGCAAYLETRRIDCLKIAPSHLAALVKESKSPAHLMRKVVIVAGEPSPASWISQWHALNPECFLLNHYGATETTIGVLAHPMDRSVSESKTGVPLGRALPNSEAYVLDRGLNAVPIGSVGEIYVSGYSLTRGYLGLPTSTAERFIPNPFGERAGDRLYRTGDLGKWRPDGRIEYLGRQDNQVKVRGFRIELGEIEAALTSFPGIQDGRVLMRQSSSGDPLMVAYVVSATSEVQTVNSLSEHLRVRLPEHMLPARIIFLKEFPRTGHGKLDLMALPDPGASVLKAGYVIPQTYIEQRIAALWAEVLEVEQIGIEDNFFDLGGHSLLLVRVHSRLGDLFGRKIPITALFQHPTVHTLARYLEGNGEADDGREGRRRAEKRKQAIIDGRTRKLRESD